MEKHRTVRGGKHLQEESWPEGLHSSVLTMHIAGMEPLMDTKVESQVQCRHITFSDDDKEGRSNLLGNTSWKRLT